MDQELQSKGEFSKIHENTPTENSHLRTQKHQTADVFTSVYLSFLFTACNKMKNKKRKT